MKDYVLGCVVAGIVFFIVGLWTGVNMYADVSAKDCATVGSLRFGDEVFTCARKQ